MVFDFVDALISKTVNTTQKTNKLVFDCSITCTNGAQYNAGALVGKRS